MYAIIVTGGKQYKVQQGDVLFVEKLEAEEGAEVKFDTVLAVGEEGAVKFGAPSVEGASVAAKVVKNGPTPRWKSPRSTLEQLETEVQHNGT